MLLMDVNFWTTELESSLHISFMPWMSAFPHIKMVRLTGFFPCHGDMRVNVDSMVVADSRYYCRSVHLGRSVCEEQVQDIVLSGGCVDDLVQA